MTQEREEWLASRPSFIGASEAAMACGVSKWGTPLSLYLRKLGLAPETEENEAMVWGKKQEPLVAEAYEEREGVKVRANGLTVWRHPEHSWFACTPDYLHDDFMVQCKTSGKREGWGDEYTDEVPIDVLIQCQAEMATMGYKRNDVPVLFSGNTFMVYRVLRKDELIDLVIKISAAFWEKVCRRTPPEPDWTHAETPKLVQMLLRPVEGFEIELPLPALEDVEAYIQHGKLLSALKKERELAQARIVIAMGEASAARLPDGRKVQRKFRKEVQVKATKRKACYDFRIVNGNNQEEEDDDD